MQPPNVSWLLAIRTAPSDNVLSEIAKRRFRKLEIREGDWGDFSWLAPFADQIERVSHSGPSLKSLKHLTLLKRLKSLELSQVPMPDMDYGEFPQLEKLSIRFSSKLVHRLDNLKSLHTLQIYGLRLNDFSSIPWVLRQEGLSLVEPRIEDWSSLSESKALRRIRLDDANQMKSLDWIKPLKDLERLAIRGAKRVSDAADAVMSCPKLEQIGLGGLDFKASPLFSSSEVLTGFPRLREFWAGIPFEQVNWEHLLSMKALDFFSVRTLGASQNDEELIKVLAEKYEKQVKFFKYDRYKGINDHTVEMQGREVLIETGF